MKYVWGTKMSKVAKATVTCDDDGNVIMYLKGSANDILKGIRLAEKAGFEPLYDRPTVLRNGRLYELTLDYYDRYWSVSRVDRAV